MNQEIKLKENINMIPEKYRFMVADFYKGGDGYWVIELADDYKSPDDKNYIWDKSRKACIDILKSLYKDSLKIKIEEASRNELLAQAKSQTKTRYDKSAQYKGFSIVDIDTTSIFKTDTITITCKVGDYHDVIELQDILIWIQMEAEKSNNQINTKIITQALMEAIDALEIKVNCDCRRFYI